VEGVRAAAGAMTVRLRLPGGQPLLARITRESAQLLALRPGLPVLALCKATAVDVAACGGTGAGAENLLHGTVARAPRAGAAGEVALALEGGQQLVGFRAAGERLPRGAPVTACVAASAVVIALLEA
jgi:molybdate transport system regulatory protein